MEGILLWLVILAAAMGGAPALQARGRTLRIPVATVTIAAITLAMSVWANLDADVLSALRRDRDRLIDGEWWRIVTPLAVQDGGWVGTIFNIVTLLVLGTIVESLFGWRALIGVYLAAGLFSEAIAYTLLRDQGFAGNSVAVMGLAGLLAVTYLRTARREMRIAGAIGGLAGAILIVTANLHGAGFAVGAIAGVILTTAPALHAE
jgi:membrane associated rhomboid family serine protease